MYRDKRVYDELDKMVIQIYLDYGFNRFPLDEFYVCERMGIELKPYSSFSPEDREILKKKSIYGFCSPIQKRMPALIFYNDSLADLHSSGCVRQTIFHEIKHYVFEDADDDAANDDLAEHFGKYFMCPTPYLIVKGIEDPEEIQEKFGVSFTMANNLSGSVKNRKRYFGARLFPYEWPLIELLDNEFYNSNFPGGECL